MKKIVKAFMVGAALSLGAMVGAAQAEGEKFVWISHGPDSDNWFNVIKNAIRVADMQMGTQTEYRNPPTGDLADMARIVQQALAAGVDGIIVTIADYSVLEIPIKDAIAKGIPVVTANSGTVEESEKLGALLHVGLPEYQSGVVAGKRVKQEMEKEAEIEVKKVLCVNHYITNPVSIERCRGFTDGLGLELGNQMIDAGFDPAEVKNKVKAYLGANPDTDAILSIGPQSAEPTIAAVREMGLDGGAIYFATFELSAEITAAIQDGTIRFAIDQQPFLQGALPVRVLADYLRYGVAPASSIATGPGIVTKENVSLIESMAGEYR